jgi:hypothetical protein
MNAQLAKNMGLAFHQLRIDVVEFGEVVFEVLRRRVETPRFREERRAEDHNNRLRDHYSAKLK